MKLATSMWSGQIRHSPPCSRSTPSDAQDVGTDARRSRRPARRGSGRDPVRGARRRRCRSRSRRRRGPAAMIAFSVPVTEASSRKSCVPVSPPAPSSGAAVRVTSRRRAARRRGCACRAAAGRSRLRRAAERWPLPQRASRGPASRIEARIRLQSSSSSSCSGIAAARIRTRPSAGASTSTPRSATSSSIVSTSMIAGTFVSVTGSSVRRHAATIGSAAFLFPAARTGRESGRPPSMTNDSWQ